MDAFRKLVSKKKRRFVAKDGGFDLDLSCTSCSSRSDCGVGCAGWEEKERAWIGRGGGEVNRGLTPGFDLFLFCFFFPSVMLLNRHAYRHHTTHHCHGFPVREARRCLPQPHV